MLALDNGNKLLLLFRRIFLRINLLEKISCGSTKDVNKYINDREI